jgi:hypothetical protein
VNGPAAETVRPRDRRARMAAWILWAACQLVAAAGFALLLANLADLGRIDLPGPLAALAVAVSYGTLGLLIIINRPRHGMGWLFLALAGPAALFFFAQQYALFDHFSASPGSLPAARWMAWLHLWLQPFPSPIALPYLLFPNGRLPSPRWRPLVWFAVVTVTLQTISGMTEPGLISVFILESPEPIRLLVTNPTGLELGWLRPIVEQGWSLALMVLVVSLAAPFVRYRHACGRERAQLRWFGYFGLLTIALFPLAILGRGFFDSLVLTMMVLVLPAATTVAILRHHLYDIDVIIRRTLVYSILTGLLALIYFGTVIALQAVFESASGQQSPVSIVISTLVIAALFSPLRRRVQGVIDRRFFRQKYDAEQVLERFSQTARDEVELEALTAELLAVVDETMRPERVGVWLLSKPAARRQDAARETRL